MQKIGLRKNLMGGWDFGGDEMLADDTVKEPRVKYPGARDHF